MKNACCLAAAALLSVVLATRAGAVPELGQPDPDADPYAQQDAEGVPLFVHQKKVHQVTQAEIDAERQRAEKAKQDQDWLLRSYEQQQQARGLDSDQSTDLYYRISTDKDLSQLAGIPTLTLGPQPAALHTGLGPSGKNAVTLRGEAPGGATHLHSFQPLITPLSAANSSSFNSFFSSTASHAPPPSTATTSHTSEDDLTKDPAAIEMPGQTAAESNPLLQDKAANLAFDLSEDEGLPRQGPQDSGSSKAELPAATNAAQLQKISDASLVVPGTVKSTKPTPLTSMQLKFQDNPAPAPFKMAPPSPVRPPIADPHDIFYH